MTIDELIALARGVIAHNAEVRTVSSELADYLDNDTADGQLARAVLSLLAPDEPCIASVDDIVSVDSDGYVTICAQQSLRGDEAQWCGVQVLRAAEKAKGEAK